MAIDLQQVCELIIDSEHKTAPTNDGPHPMVRTSNIGQGFLVLKVAKMVDDETYRKWTPAPTRTLPPPAEAEPTPEEVEGLKVIIKAHGYELLI